MAERSREARELDRTLTYLIGKAWLDHHPLGNPSLLARLVRESCQGLALSDVLPKPDAYSVEEGDSLNPETRQYLVYRSLRAVLLFDFARLAHSQLEPERLAGTVVLAFRWQVAAEPETGTVVPIEECTRRLTDNARSTTEFIHRLWAVFEAEFNAKLPVGKKLPTPKSLPDAGIFRGQSPTTFTNSYQDAELLSIFKRLLQIDPGFRLPPFKQAKNKAALVSERAPQPSGSEPLTVPTTQASVISVITTINEDRLFANLRERLAAATETLPAPFHPQAFSAAAIPRLYPPLPDLSLLGQKALDLKLPASLFVTPPIWRVALPVSGLTVLEQREYQLADLMTTPQALLIGQPGAGKTTLLARLAHHLNQRRLDDGSGPFLMLTVNADEFVAHATMLKLSAFAAQALHENGFAPETPTEHLACRLETWSEQGYLCWGVDNVDERLGDDLDTLLVELQRVKSYLLALGIIHRPFIRKVQTALGNLDSVYALQPFDEARIRQYCEQYVSVGVENTGPEARLPDDDPMWGLNVNRMLLAAKANPELAQTPLGLACLCVGVENTGKLLNATRLYISERLCRAGFQPDVWLNTFAPPSSLTHALYRVVREYWNAHQTLEGALPISASELGGWLVPSGEAERRQAWMGFVRATQLLVPTYDNGAFRFSHETVYHSLLALAYLADYEYYWGHLLLPTEVRYAFRDPLPEEILRLIGDMAYTRFSP